MRSHIYLADFENRNNLVEVQICSLWMIFKNPNNLKVIYQIDQIIMDDLSGIYR